MLADRNRSRYLVSSIKIDAPSSPGLGQGYLFRPVVAAEFGGLLDRALLAPISAPAGVPPTMQEAVPT
ncbi:MAG TPA: hypothetical protein VFF24_13355 [Acidimicrobiia bacterium]|nr:hypothetical protein [Acidimicrobiia bacterium]